MKQRNRNRIFKIIGFLAVMGVMIWIATLIDPVALVGRVGQGWIYVILFFVALVSGVSTLTAGPFYLALVVALSGGLHPLAVALVVAPAIVVSDLVFLGLVANTAELIAEKSKTLRRFEKWLEKKPHWIIHLATYLYFAFAPISSDFFLALLGLADVKAKEIWLYVLLGNLTFFIWLGYLVHSGSPLVGKII